MRFSLLNPFKKQRKGLEVTLALDNPDMKVPVAYLDGQLLWYGVGVARRSETHVGAGGGLGANGAKVEGTFARERELEWKLYFDKRKMAAFGTEDQIKESLIVDARAISGNPISPVEVRSLPEGDIRFALPGDETESKTGTIIVSVNQPGHETDKVRELTLGYDPKHYEIFTGEKKRLISVRTPQQLQEASAELNSITPEGSSESPLGLWVKVTVDGCLDDLKTLARRLDQRLYVSSIGFVEPM
jgi:hypothetical protein